MLAVSLSYAVVAPVTAGFGFGYFVVTCVVARALRPRAAALHRRWIWRAFRARPQAERAGATPRAAVGCPCPPRAGRMGRRMVATKLTAFARRGLRGQARSDDETRRVSQHLCSLVVADPPPHLRAPAILPARYALVKHQFATQSMPFDTNGSFWHLTLRQTMHGLLLAQVASRALRRVAS